MKKRFAVLWICVLCLGLLLYNLFAVPDPHPNNQISISPDRDNSDKSDTAQTAQVRILNTDPAHQGSWEQLAQKYSQLTGVDVVVCDEDSAEEATLFTVTDQSQILADACQDLSGTTAFGQLADMGLALKIDGKYCAIAMEIDCFGLIFNENLLAEMVTQEEIRDINSFSSLVQSIAANGYVPFAGRGLSDGVATHLASIPGNYRTLAQLWVTHADQSDTPAIDRFLNGEAVFYLGSADEYDDLLHGGIEAMGILPIFLDQGEAAYVQQSLCVTPKKYWCVRSTAGAEDVAATLEFLNWLVKPMEDGSVPVDSLEILSPYRQAKFYANPLENTLKIDLSMGKSPVVCKNLTEPPDGFIEALNEFSKNPTDENWQQVLSCLQ